jgi:DNA-binding transcriptional ArsR family regulator
MVNIQVGLDSVFHALSDPTRRAVVQRLGRGSATVSELAEPFDMTLPAFMKHMGVLEESGLIRSSKSGRTRTCILEHRKLGAVERWLGDQRSVWESRHRNLDKLLENLSGKQHET